MIKEAHLNHPIHELLQKRWSPCAFSDRTVALDDLRSIFEAARWAQSSFNEQPWAYIVARKENAAEHQQLVRCLVAGNQPWAEHAPVLAIGLTHPKFSTRDMVNKAAEHDLGAASATLTFEATARGLHVHQMIGINPDIVREIFHVPEDVKPLTGLAIGYLGDPNFLPENYRQRDLTPRARKEQNEFIFAGDWGKGWDI